MIKLNRLTEYTDHHEAYNYNSKMASQLDDVSPEKMQSFINSNRTRIKTENNLKKRLEKEPKDRLQQLLNNEFRNAVVEFDWFKLGVLIKMYYDFSLNFDNCIEKAKNLIVECEKFIYNKNEDKKIPKLAILEMLIEIFGDYAIDKTYEQLLLICKWNPIKSSLDEVEFFGPLLKIMHICLDQKGLKAQNLLKSLMDSESFQIRDKAQEMHDIYISN